MTLDLLLQFKCISNTLRQFTALMNLQSLWLLDKGQGKVVVFLAKVQESTIFTLVLKPHPADQHILLSQTLNRTNGRLKHAHLKTWLYCDQTLTKDFINCLISLLLNLHLHGACSYPGGKHDKNYSKLSKQLCCLGWPEGTTASIGQRSTEPDVQ